MKNKSSSVFDTLLLIAPLLIAPLLAAVLLLCAALAGTGCAGFLPAGRGVRVIPADEHSPGGRVFANARRAGREGTADTGGEIIEVGADPAAGFFWPYLLFEPSLPAGAERPSTALTILVCPNNTGGVSDDFSEHARAAAKHFPRCRRRAGSLGCACLMPIFPRLRTDWRIYTHALDRDCLTTKVVGLERLDRQLLAMIDDATARLACSRGEVNAKVLLAGFSASGMFANRFAILHPERVRAAAIGSPGGWPIAPVAFWQGMPLCYPVGVHDLETLTGERFDIDRFREISFFFFLGSEDENDSVTFDDGYDDEDERRIIESFGPDPVSRWPHAHKLYESAGAVADFRLYQEAGHRITDRMERDMMRFFRDALASP
jgi:pimeloyl-ACP methyl ester carboxylesterase